MKISWRWTVRVVAGSAIVAGCYVIFDLLQRDMSAVAKWSIVMGFGGLIVINCITIRNTLRRP